MARATSAPGPASALLVLLACACLHAVDALSRGDAVKGSLQFGGDSDVLYPDNIAVLAGTGGSASVASLDYTDDNDITYSLFVYDDNTASMQMENGNSGVQSYPQTTWSLSTAATTGEAIIGVNVTRAVGLVGPDAYTVEMSGTTNIVSIAIPAGSLSGYSSQLIDLELHLRMALAMGDAVASTVTAGGSNLYDADTKTMVDDGQGGASGNYNYDGSPHLYTIVSWPSAVQFGMTNYDGTPVLYSALRWTLAIASPTNASKAVTGVTETVITPAFKGYMLQIIDNTVVVDINAGTLMGYESEFVALEFQLASPPVPSPASSPELEPSPLPALEPSPSPALEPSLSPELEPSPSPALEPSPSPALEPSPSPALEPSPSPALEPSPSPALEPSPSPTLEPSPSPVLEPSPSPPLEPSPSPELEPSPSPALEPSPSPELEPSPSPALVPSPSPALVPSPSPALLPSPSPALLPSPSPALLPSPSPALRPSPSPALLPCAGLPPLFPADSMGWPASCRGATGVCVALCTKPGFTTPNPPTSRCVNGTWSAVAPASCGRVCTDRPTFSPGSVVWPSSCASTVAGSGRCMGGCAAGLYGRPSAPCLASGTWGAQEGACSAGGACVGMPPQMLNTLWPTDALNAVAGSKVTATCNSASGFRPSATRGAPTITCVASASAATRAMWDTATISGACVKG